MIKTTTTKTIFLIGFGDVAKRAVFFLRKTRLVKEIKLFALVRRMSTLLQSEFPEVRFIQADLDDPYLIHHMELKRLFKLTDLIIYLAPPPTQGQTDPRLKKIVSLYTSSHPKKQRKIIYISTTGVYGHCFGAFVKETQPVLPQTARAMRRVHAELLLRQKVRERLFDFNILRVPGIYACDRLPVARLEQKLPVIFHEEDSYTNHIHAEDLARSLFYCACFGKKRRTYHIVDESQLKMGEYFDQVAHFLNLPLPPRVSREAIQTLLSPMQLSFLNESRRIQNTRLKKELRIRLCFPEVSPESLSV